MTNQEIKDLYKITSDYALKGINERSKYKNMEESKKKDLAEVMAVITIVSELRKQKVKIEDIKKFVEIMRS